jgi:hypothetical protein
VAQIPVVVQFEFPQPLTEDFSQAAVRIVREAKENLFFICTASFSTLRR